MSDKEYELLGKGVVIAWDEGLMTKEEMERALAYLDTLATIGGADKATLARKLRRAHAATRDAEQRATASEARAERLAAAVRDLWPKVPDYKTRDLSAATFGVVNQEFSPFALTAPATQPDERAAAIKAALDRLAKRILAGIVYCAPENRALAEEVARAAKIETDLILARHGRG